MVMSLQETGLFGIRDKVKIALERIKTFEPKEGYYVAFSGGKDSVVILDLVKQAGVKFDAHYNITGVDPPELFYFIRDQHPEVQRHRPEITMWALIAKKMMPPTRTARFCCEYLKEGGGVGRIVVTGIRWAESVRRGRRRMLEICARDKLKTYFHPIIDWTAADVWEYIHMNNVPYCSLYDEGFKRLGCIGCPMNTKRYEEFKRWPRYETLYRRAFQQAVEARRNRPLEWHSKHPLRVIWNSGDDMWDWWMSEKSPKGICPDQTVLFE